MSDPRLADESRAYALPWRGRGRLRPLERSMSENEGASRASVSVEISWERTVTGTTEVKVDPDEVLAWANEGRADDEPNRDTKLTPRLLREWFMCQRDDWHQAVEFDGDVDDPQPWDAYEIEGVVVLANDDLGATS